MRRLKLDFRPMAIKPFPLKLSRRLNYDGARNWGDLICRAQAMHTKCLSFVPIYNQLCDLKPVAKAKEERNYLQIIELQRLAYGLRILEEDQTPFPKGLSDLAFCGVMTFAREQGCLLGYFVDAIKNLNDCYVGQTTELDERFAGSVCSFLMFQVRMQTRKLEAYKQSLPYAETLITVLKQVTNVSLHSDIEAIATNTLPRRVARPTKCTPAEVSFIDVIRQSGPK